jgi:diguanylate cyclase (GGDEF)-like protein
MGIAARITLLYACAGLLLSAAAATYVAQQKYQSTLDNLVDDATAHAQHQVDLQYYIYGSNSVGLKRILGDFLGPNAVSSAAILSSHGDVLAWKNRDGASDKPAVAMRDFRSDAAISDTTLNAFDNNHRLSGTGFWASLLAHHSPVNLITPVFSPVNPAVQGQLLTDFADALNHPDANKSLVVIGYLYLTIDRGTIFHDLGPVVARSVVLSLVAFAVCALLLVWAFRQTLQPISQLNQTARRIMAGKDFRPVILEKTSELSVVAELLNGLLERAKTFRSEIGLEHKLLQMQADERASQLSLREIELSKAAEEINATRQQLHQLANYDRLTSLPNRQLFTEQLNVLLRLCARDAKPLALLFINLNNFHRINESLGRATGDAILQEVGRRLESCLRNSDILAHYVNSDDALRISRLGGDEFAVVLSRLDQIDSAGIVAQRIADKLVESMDVDGHELVVTPSIGIAVAPRNAMEVEGLLKAASIAMHHAKSTDNANFLFYSDDMEARGQDDLKMESELRRAIERNELSLHFQPQVDTTNGGIICAEAFLRWEHPKYGFVAPSKFIGLAEKMGLIWELGDWALVAACRQMKAFQEQKLQLKRIAINISPQQFKPAFATRVREVLANVGLPASMLELGLSETILVAKDQIGLQLIQDLKILGVYLSLENFGTNNAPISYLGRYPLDEIKIDRSFVADCNKRKDAGRLVKAIIAMATSLELRTVAEGVETEGEYRFLADNGVGIMRGYLFSKPLPAAQLKQLLIVPWHFMTQLQRMALLHEDLTSADS